VTEATSDNRRLRIPSLVLYSQCQRTGQKIKKMPVKQAVFFSKNPTEKRKKHPRAINALRSI